MIRSDKEINDRQVIESVIKKSKLCRIALCEGGAPYIVPVCFGFEGNCIYIHSAREGRKLDALRKNNNVCFEFESEIELTKSESPCSWGMKYYSVIGFGKAYLIDDPAEKRKALRVVIEHYAGESFFEYSKMNVDKLILIKIEVESLTGKKSGY
jgi:hypothetical protein